MIKINLDEYLSTYKDKKFSLANIAAYYGIVEFAESNNMQSLKKSEFEKMIKNYFKQKGYDAPLTQARMWTGNRKYKGHAIKTIPNSVRSFEDLINRFAVNNLEDALQTGEIELKNPELFETLAYIVEQYGEFKYVIPTGRNVHNPAPSLINAVINRLSEPTKTVEVHSAEEFGNLYNELVSSVYEFSIKRAENMLIVNMRDGTDVIALKDSLQESYNANCKINSQTLTIEDAALTRLLYAFIAKNNPSSNVIQQVSINE